MDALEQDRGDAVARSGALHGIDVVEGDMKEAFGQRLKDLVLAGLARRVQRRQSPAVERAVGADDGVAPRTRPLARELDGALVGLGSGVRKEHPSAATEQAIEGARHLWGDDGAVKIGDVQQCAGLLTDGVRDPGVGVPQ